MKHFFTLVVLCVATLYTPVVLAQNPTSEGHNTTKQQTEIDSSKAAPDSVAAAHLQQEQAHPEAVKAEAEKKRAEKLAFEAANTPQKREEVKKIIIRELCSCENEYHNKKMERLRFLNTPRGIAAAGTVKRAVEIEMGTTVQDYADQEKNVKCQKRYKPNGTYVYNNTYISGTLEDSPEVVAVKARNANERNAFMNRVHQYVKQQYAAGKLKR